MRKIIIVHSGPHFTVMTCDIKKLFFGAFMVWFTIGLCFLPF